MKLRLSSSVSVLIWDTFNLHLRRLIHFTLDLDPDTICVKFPSEIFNCMKKTTSFQENQIK